jgi:hypothetical protein
MVVVQAYAGTQTMRETGFLFWEGSTIHKYAVGDVVKTRKPHPCGGDLWEVIRVGVDFRIKCLKCGRVLLLPRPKFEKSVKAVVQQDTGGNVKS